MKMLFGIEHAASALTGPQSSGSVVTVGAFDGVHRGHKALFTTVAHVAADRGMAAVIVTFDPHPARFLLGSDEYRCLATRDENLALLAVEPVDYAVVLEFNAEFAALTPREFAERIVVGALNTQCWVMGPTHRFGRGGAGDVEEAKRLGVALGFDVLVTGSEVEDGDLVSSTRIRDAIAQGDVALARRMLGRPYGIAGQVAPGERRGRSLGFPTANIAPSPCKVLPPAGVYAATAAIDGGNAMPAAAYVGRSPTFQGRSATIVECHILENGEGQEIPDLYGHRLDVMFIERLREERRFAGPAELAAQIGRDVAQAARILS